ncbi:hypothetical protein C0J52_01721 [Blattella germanica]|nr:hypothetical protein C0J52_01721 [Blattella germanica]
MIVHEGQIALNINTYKTLALRVSLNREGCVRETIRFHLVLIILRCFREDNNHIFFNGSIDYSNLERKGRSGNCPLKNTVTRCMNRCKTDFDCSSGKKCCPNICGSQSCADASSISTGSDSRYSKKNKPIDYRIQQRWGTERHRLNIHVNPSHGSSDVYCSNVKCQSGERCVLDKTTKREKCGRS